MLYNFLFPQNFRGKGISLLILLVRVAFGILFFTHGLDKMMNFNELSDNFPAVAGFGGYTVLMVTIFCEFCCSLFLITGFLVRIMTLPMIIAMGVAFFDIHDAMIPEGELALIYLIVFIILFIFGPGIYSIDYIIDNRFQKQRKQANL